MEAKKQIKGLEEIQGVKDFLFNKTEPHIYFLTKNDVVVYVGQSEKPIGQRIGNHAQDRKKEFDGAYTLKVDRKDQLSIVEGFFINKLSPLYNKTLPCTAEVCGYTDLEHVLQDWESGKLKNKENKIKNKIQKINKILADAPSQLPEWKQRYYEWKRAKDERWVTVSERLPDGIHQVKIHSIEPWEPPESWVYAGDMLQVFFLGGEHGNQSDTMLFNLPDNCIVGKGTKLGKLAKAVFQEDQIKRPFDYYNDLIGKEIIINVETQHTSSHMAHPKITSFWAIGEFGEQQRSKTQKLKDYLKKGRRKKPSDSLGKRKKIDLDRVRAKVS